MVDPTPHQNPIMGNPRYHCKPPWLCREVTLVKMRCKNNTSWARKTIQSHSLDWLGQMCVWKLLGVWILGDTWLGDFLVLFLWGSVFVFICLMIVDQPGGYPSFWATLVNVGIWKLFFFCHHHQAVLGVVSLLKGRLTSTRCDKDDSFIYPHFPLYWAWPKKKWYHLVYRFFRGCCNLEKTFRFGGWKQIGHKKDWLSKQKKEAEAPNIPTLCIYIYTTYGTLGNTYPPGWSTRGGEWREMTRCRQVAMAAQVWCCSIASIQGYAADETTGNHRNDSLRSLPMKKSTPKHQKRKLYISCIYNYIYIVLWQHVYIYILICIYMYIYTVLSSNSSIFLGDFTNYRVVAYSFSTSAGCMMAVLVCLRAPSGFIPLFNKFRRICHKV